MHEFKNATPIRKLIPEIAKENNVDPKMLKDVFEAYYMELNKEIVSAKKPIIIILGLGRLKLSKNKISFTISKIKEFLEKSPEDTFRYKMLKKYYTNQRLLKLQKSLNQIEKNEQEAVNKYNERLEKQKSNN